MYNIKIYRYIMYINEMQKYITTVRIHNQVPNVSFSPESGGSVNPSKVIAEINTHGMIRLNP